MNQPLENIIKQGYLKKGNTWGNRISALIRQKFEGQKWFVFTIRQGIPYLEYYDSNTEVFCQKPINSYCLSQCTRVSALERTNPPCFTICCSDRFLELVASSRPQMLEWAHDIKVSLNRLGILEIENNEHVYTVLPAVVRQPRVSHSQVDESEAVAAVQSPPPLDLTTSSSQQSENGPPPIPQRPQRATMRPKKTVSSPATAKTVEDLNLMPAVELESSLEKSDNYQCSNDSDFVSWNEVMKVRESFLQRSVEENQLDDFYGMQAGGAAGGAVGSVQGENVDAINNPSASSRVSEGDFNGKPQHRAPLVELDNSYALAAGMNCYSTFPECEFSLSSELERDKHLAEGNDYSLLPSGLMLGGNEECYKNDTETKAPVKPVPMPRRGMSVRNNSQEKNDLRDKIDHNVNGFRARDLSPSQSEEDKTESKEAESLHFQKFSEMFDEFLYDNSGRHANGINIEENGLKASEIKDENANFYDPKNSTSHCVLAPPTIPPRCDSLSDWAQTSPLSSLCGQNNTANCNIYSPSLPSSDVESLRTTSSNMLNPPSDCSSPHKDNESNLHPLHQLPSIPPLPIPRRKTAHTVSAQSAFHTTDGNEYTAMDGPPKLPRRTLPQPPSLTEDSPPQLPSRLSKSVAKGRPKLTSSFSFGVSDDRSKLLGDDSSITSEASLRDRDRKGATAPVMRQSGLSKKMLLDRANSLHTVVSLKKTQAEILQAEIDKDHVSVTLTQKSGHGLALVDWNGMPCVAGWNQKDFPSLHGKLHIGDMLISVNNVRASNVEMTQKLLRNAMEPKIEVMLQRMPYAKVFAIRREAEGQSLGLRREGGTGEILYVDPNGLAAMHGLPQYAQGAMGKPRCSWFLTEINSRPLNLFFKENEIEHLLYAVGREISIVVQPSDFVLEIRRGLKKLKNHKSFITQ